jgi:hypothetical protein
VLILAVLVSATAAQAYAMPCCQIASVVAAPVVTATPAADDAMATMHCHGMSRMAASVTLSLTKCPVPVCSIHLEVATAATEDAVLTPLLNATQTSLPSLPSEPVTRIVFSTGHVHPPGFERTIRVPLRV